MAEAGCLGHARRKFFDLWANHKSQLAEEALNYFVQLYEVEREMHDLGLDERPSDEDPTTQGAPSGGCH